MAPISARTVSATASAVTCGSRGHRPQDGQALAGDAVATLAEEVGRVRRHVLNPIESGEIQGME